MLSIIIPIGALLIAILAVAAFWLWLTGDPPAEVATEQSGGLIFAESPAPVVAAATSMPAQAHYTPSSDELLRVMRGSDGQMQIQINGTTYRNMGDMSRDPLLREHFMGTLRSLAEFAQDTSGVVTAPAPVTMAPAQPAAYVAAPVTATIANKDEIVEADPESVAAQIERFLQDRLARTPGMMSRSIHIYSAANGGVQIKVDSTLYESVGDVTEIDAREIIERSIQDWEASLSV
jgi:hypothetical protein